MVVPDRQQVTASVPCFGDARYLRRAVESLLAQTHRALTVVVVSDGDPNPPWKQLAHIRDPRLVRFELERNHGPYFVHQVVLGASLAPFLLIQDADDWSAPDRVRTLLRMLHRDGSDMAFSAWQQYTQEAGGALRTASVRWRRADRDARKRERFLFDPILTDDFINRASHHGVFRAATVKRLGGYYGGFRINYDTLLTNLLLMVGKVSFVQSPLYHYVLRRDSLSHSPVSGAFSPERIRVRKLQAAIYREALRFYRDWRRGRMTSPELMRRIREASAVRITAQERAELASETARLANLLRGRR